MTEETTTRSTLSQLRALAPHRALTPSETRQVIERQTTRLLKLAGVFGPPVPIEEIIRALPRIEIKAPHPDLPTSGRTQWTGSRWAIMVAADEPRVRQRFSLAHELAHVVYHPLSDRSLPAISEKQMAETRLEQACEYFAACLLMPRVWMKRAYYEGGIDDLPGLARLFNVSWVAMEIRLEQLGLVTRPSADYARSAA